MKVTIWFENVEDGYKKFDNVQEINHKYNKSEIVIHFKSKENKTLNMNNVKKFFTYE